MPVRFGDMLAVVKCWFQEVGTAFSEYYGSSGCDVYCSRGGSDKDGDDTGVYKRRPAVVDMSSPSIVWLMTDG